MSNKFLRIGFSDFWPGFDPASNFVIENIAKEWRISDKPDVLIYSCFGETYTNFHECLKVAFIGENIRPNFIDCDYAISFELEDHGGRNFRWPLYNLYYDPKFIPPRAEREKFCCMVVSNTKNRLRLHFFEALSKYKRVDSGGRICNNIGAPVQDKMEFIKQYRFCLAFENASYPGYTTEKILQAKLAGCIPIYWGNPEVAMDFDTNSFINANEYRTFAECIEAIRAVNEDGSTFERMQRTPILKNNEYTRYSDKRGLQVWLNGVMETGQRPHGWKIFSAFIDRKNRILTRLLDRSGQARFRKDWKSKDRLK